MKRLFGWLLLALFCVGAMGVAKSEDQTLDSQYETIVTMYKIAIEKQEVYGEVQEAIDDLKAILDLYSGIEDTKLWNYDDTQNYYRYAVARVELSKDKPDYALALEQLGKCGDALYLVSDYQLYASGMRAAENGDYAKAISTLRQVGLKEFTSKRNDAIEEYRQLFRASVLASGKKAFDSGNYDAAESVYDQYLELFEDDSEIIRLRDACRESGQGEGTVEASGVEIINAVATSPRTMRLSWQGSAEQYTVRWTSDLTSNRDSQSAEVTGREYTVEDLLPGTVYRFTVSDNGSSAEMDRETPKAPKYVRSDGQERFWTGSSSLYRFNGSREAFLGSDSASYAFIGDASCKYLKSHTVDLYGEPFYESCIVFVFPTFSIPEDIDGKPCTVLLHLDGLGTLAQTATFGDRDVCGDGNNIYVLVYDLFDQAISRYAALTDQPFRLELLVDDMLVGTSDGTLQ